MSEIPPLEPHCGSWIAVSRATGKPAIEIFKADRALAEQINFAAYAVFTAAQWLGAMNAAIKAGPADYCREALASLNDIAKGP